MGRNLGTERGWMMIQFIPEVIIIAHSLESSETYRMNVRIHQACSHLI